VADAATHRGRFTAHERSTVIGSTPIPVYPPGPAWCADPGALCVEPPLGLDNPALEPSSVPPDAQATDPASTPSTPLGRDVGSLSHSGDQGLVSQPSSHVVRRGSPVTYRRF
jgi:hypothetical protein